MRWRREVWEEIEQKAAALGIDAIDIVRHATLRALGMSTDSDALQRVAKALDEMAEPAESAA
jgi:hypothetical protein